jgi:hypothetical protein
MMISINMKKKAETKSDFGCDFCNRSFIRETTMMKHLCEYKRRWQDKDKAGNRIGFQSWMQFYTKNTSGTKKRTYLDFTKSAYYIAFVKFGNYCVNAHVVNVSRYMDYLLKNDIKIDTWSQDTTYTKFLIQYLKEEDPLDAIARSIESTTELAQQEKIQTKDCLRYGNRNRVCYSITNGKISPWLLYQSESGVQFLESLDVTQQQMIIDYINPEQWAIKFLRDKEILTQVKELLMSAGY